MSSKECIARMAHLDGTLHHRPAPLFYALMARGTRQRTSSERFLFLLFFLPMTKLRYGECKIR